MQFRTKARAVDLLGKGQIADLPTAITELWKNGYDAYADNLSAEIFMSGYKGLESPLFVISDDGIGMTQADILDKWLVLGVDSKSRSSQIDVEGEETLWKKPRVKAGEKGIGRLSVAFLGSPMLMLTKKKGYPLQAMYFDWRVLENYNMFLDDVEIPVKSINVLDFRNTFGELKKLFLKNLEEPKSNSENRIRWESGQETLKHSIEESTKRIILPAFFEQEILGFFANKESHGTKFVIFEPEEQLVNLVNSSDQEDDVNDTEFVRTSLVGFTNQFESNSKRLPINCSFPIHKKGDDFSCEDFFVGNGEFFTEKDYDIADIVIEGSLDGNGTFNGSLKIYGQVIDYTYTNPRKKDVRSNYGKVPLKIGYSMGKVDDSSNNEEVWNRINKKVDAYGGIYIYRDGFRVLPYGRIDADFLALEERRNKRIGTYFFSYRRMFGYLELSRTRNSQLKDKSSREGFINNAAYRVFKDDLSAMFIDLAKEYFADKARQSIFLDEKKKAKAQSEVLKKDKEREKQEKTAFTKGLKEYPKRFETYKRDYENTIKELQNKIGQSDMIFSDIELLLKRIQELEVQYSELLPKMPTRYKLTETQEDRLASYEKRLIEFRNSINAKGNEVVKAARARLQIQDLRKDFVNRCNTYIVALDEIIGKQRNRFDTKVAQLGKDVESKTFSFLADLKNQKNKSLNAIFTKEDIEREITTIHDLFSSLQTNIAETIEPFITHIERMSLDIDEELLQGAYKEEYDKIKEQWNLSRETSQLGIAVEIIDHEFNSLYTRINSSLDTLSKTINTPEYVELKKSFKTLEDKYALLSPLYRISGSIAKDIKGIDLKTFLLSFFENRLSSTNVIIKSSKEFDNLVVHIKEPVIYSVLINIVNNALYWMKNSEIKIIEFAYDVKTDGIIIRNSGLPIQENKLQKIFGLFYSNRPNGRGLGLYLAKQSLNDCYFDIYATNDHEYNTLNGACFVVKPFNK